MLRFIGQRFTAMVIIVFILTAAVFALQKMSPLDPAHARLGGQASQTAIAHERHVLGLDRPITSQFGSYLNGLLHGDLGESYRTRRPVRTDLVAYVPATAELAGAGLADRADSGDRCSRSCRRCWSPGPQLFRLLLMLGAAVPTFLLGIFGILLFYQRLGWLPASGRTSIADAPTGPTRFLTVDGLLHGRLDVTWDAIGHLIMPATAIALIPAVAIGRVLRASLDGELGSDYVRNARAKGRSERQILFGHVLRNSIGAAASMTGLQVGLMFAGVLVVEQVFAWPGLGLYIAESIPVADFPAIAGVTLLLGVTYVVINAAVDLIQAAADRGSVSERPPMIVGRPVLVVVDFQKGTDEDVTAAEFGMEVMPGGSARIERAERILSAARDAAIPVIFLQEMHRPSGIDFGRELDGAEGIHCVEGESSTELVESLRPLPDEFHIVKRRYSGFYGTELEILLRALKAETLILIGGLTDVCIQYTFADAHQRDYYVRVVGDCVGGSSEARHIAALDAMEYLQAGAVLSTNQLIDAFDELGSSSTTTRIHHGGRTVKIASLPSSDASVAAVGAAASLALALAACGGGSGNPGGGNCRRRSDFDHVAAPLVPAGSGPAAGPGHLLRRPGPDPDHQRVRGPAYLRGGHRDADSGTRASHGMDRVEGQQDLHLRTA